MDISENDAETLSHKLPKDITASFNLARTLSTNLNWRGYSDDESIFASRLSISIPRQDEGTGQSSDKDVDYSLLRLLGAGGMGEVWEAEQRSLDRIVAVKRLSPKLVHTRGDSPQAIAIMKEEFRREALIAARLEHPNIVPVHDRGVDEEGSPLLAMKLVQGRPWNVLLDDDFKSLDIDEYLHKHLAILSQMTQAVVFAHSRGIVHRDLKPSQVMVGDFGEVMLMDWGLAFFIGDAPEDRDWVQRTGITTQRSASNPSGTIAFMAPEQTLHTSNSLGPWTDVYLLGATLYFLLTGTLPHQGDSSEIAFANASKGVVEAPSHRAPDRQIPAELEALCLKSMAPEPANRLDSAQSFLEALEEYLLGKEKKTKSRNLTKEAGERLQRPNLKYGEYVEILNLLEQAHRNWPNNPETANLKNSALEATARLALTNGDLTLARLQTEAITIEEIAEPLSAEVQLAEKKLQRRHRQFRAAVASLLFMLLLIAVGSSLFVVKLQSANVKTMVERDRANAARNEAQELVGFMLGDLTERLGTIGRLEIMDSVLAKVDSMLAVREGSVESPEEQFASVSLQLQLVKVRIAQGKLEEASIVIKSALAEALALAKRDSSNSEWQEILGDAWISLGETLTQQGIVVEAQNAIEKNLEIREMLVSSDPAGTFQKVGLVNAWHHLGDVLKTQGRLEEARNYFESALEMSLELAELEPTDEKVLINLAVSWNRIGDILDKQGNLEEARGAHEKHLSVMERLLALDPDNIGRQRDLAIGWGIVGAILEKQGSLELAQDAYTKCLEYLTKLVEMDPTNAEWRRDLGIVYSHVGGVLESQGKLEEAGEAFARSLEISLRLVESDPSNNLKQEFLANAWFNVGGILKKQGKLDEAQAAFEKDIEIGKRLVESDPSNSHWQRELARSKARLAAMLQDQGKLEEAHKLFEENLEVLRQLADSDPTNLGRQRDLALSWDELGTNLQEQGKLNEALEAFENNLEIFLRLEASDSTNVDWQENLGDAWYSLGFLHQHLGNLELAREAYEKNLQIYLRLVETDPINVSWQRSLGLAWDRIGDILNSEGNLEEALEAYEKYLKVTQWLAEKDTTNVDLQHDLAIAKGRIGNVYLNTGNLEKARELFTESIESFAHLADSNPAIISYQQNMSALWNSIGIVFQMEGNLEEALGAFEKDLEIAERLANLNPDVPDPQRDLAFSWRQIGKVLRDQGKLIEAGEAHSKEVEIMEKLITTHPTDSRWQLSGAMAWIHLGEVKEAMGEQKSSEIAYQKGVELLDRSERSPNTLRPSNQALIAKALHGVGRTDEARMLAESLMMASNFDTLSGNDRNAFVALCEEMGLIVPEP